MLDMSSCNRHHHNPKNANFNSHTISIGGTEYCLGCTINKLFVVIVFPILFLLVLYPGYIMNQMLEYSLIAGVWIIYSMALGRYYFNGYSAQNTGLLQSIFTVSTVVYTIFVPERINMPRLIWIPVILPQYFLYLYKIVLKREFTWKAIKSSIRLSYVLGIFLFLVEMSDNYVNYGILGTLLFYAFIKLRNFSSYRVEGDGLYLHSSGIEGFLNKLTPNIVRNGRIEENSLISRPLIAKTLTWSLIFVFFLINIISKQEISSCNTMNALAVPVALSSRRNVYCAECGAQNDVNAKFCQECGLKIDPHAMPVKPAKGSEVAQQPRPYDPNPYIGGPQGYDPTYPGSMPHGGQGYSQQYPVQRQQNRNHIIIAALAGAFLFYIMSANFLFSIVIGPLFGIIAYYILFALISSGCLNCWSCYCCSDCCGECCVDCCCNNSECDCGNCDCDCNC